jgi:hypothetical protein
LKIPRLTAGQRKLVRLANNLGIKVRYDTAHAFKYDRDMWERDGLTMVGDAPGVCQLLEDEHGQQWISSPYQFDGVDFLHELCHVLISRFYPHKGIESDEIEAGMIALEQIISRRFSPKLARDVNRTHHVDYSWNGVPYNPFKKYEKQTQSAWHWIRSDDHRSDKKFWSKKLEPILRDIV